MNIFDLRTEMEDEIKNIEYVMVQTDRSVKGDNYVQGGNLSFKWKLLPNQWWLSNKSYMVVRIGLTKANGQPLLLADNIAPNRFLAENLFINTELRINGKRISDVPTYNAECASLKYRLIKPVTWTQNFGHDSDFMDVSYLNRMYDVIGDSPLANLTRQKSYIELFFTPNLGVYDLPHAIAGGAEYELVFNVNPNFQIECVESTATKSPVTDYKFSVQDMFYFNCIVSAPTPRSESYVMSFFDIRCRKTQLNGSGGAVQELNWELDPNAKFISIACQNKAAGTSTIYSKTFFSVGGASGASGNDLGNEMKLKFLKTNYKGVNRSLVLRDLEYVNTNGSTIPGIDYTGRLYMENCLTSNKYYLQDSAESLENFQVGGPYYHYDCGYDPYKDPSNNLQVQIQFATKELQNPAIDLDSSNINVLLFEHIKRNYRVKLDKDGNISSIDKI